MYLLRFIFNFLVLSIPAILAGLWARHLARTSHDEWKILVWVPCVPLVWFALVIAKDVARDPTSQNLWPFGLFFVAILSLALFTLILFLRYFANRSHERRPRWERDRTT